MEQHGATDNIKSRVHSKQKMPHFTKTPILRCGQCHKVPRTYYVTLEEKQHPFRQNERIPDPSGVLVDKSGAPDENIV